MDSVTTVHVKKSRRGNIFNSVHCNYLRSDLQCYHSSCVQCMNPSAPLKSATIYILDYSSLSLYFSFLESQDFFTPANTVFPQSHLTQLKKQDLRLYDKLKSFLIDKEFCVFMNEHHKFTYLPTTAENRSDQAAHKLKSFYDSHIPSVKTLVISSEIPRVLLDSYYVDYIPFKISPQPPVFPAHLSPAELLPRIKSGELFQGVFHVMRYDLSKSWVSITQGYPSEIQASLVGIHANRAIDGDIVAVEIIGGMEVEEKLENEEEVQVVSTGKIKEARLPALEARVVGVVKRKLKHYCGTIRRSGELWEGREICYFSPINPKIPDVRLVCRHPERFEGQRISVEIDSWEPWSELPQGHVVRIIGSVTELATESEVILLEHDVVIKPFTKAALACLPQRDWIIPPEELKSRTDLRDRCVASVDPPGCKDIDDALHCRVLPNGNYEIGVHIADVTYFVKANSALDLEASERCTTVYLVEKRTDMLPGVLTEVLCSLVCNQDRLAFSVLWEIHPQTGEILNTVYTKSIIHSRASLSYQAASELINSQNNSELAGSLRRLLEVSKMLKQKRIQNGALELASTEVKFELDTEKQGKNIALYKTYETNSMVEEFMLLANVAVAEKIVEAFPAYGVLRRHPEPKMVQLAELAEKLKKLGYLLEYSSSKSLAESLNGIKSEDIYINTLVRMQVTRCMNQAVYFCSSEFDRLDYKHYGLASEIYTHFTSPIRRYADVLVHRLLSAAIDIESLPDTMTDRRIMNKICRRMNFRNRMSQFAERTSANLHTYLVFKSKGTCEEEAIVTEIFECGVNVIVPSIGLEGSVELEGSPSEDKIQWIMNKKNIRLYHHLKVQIQISFENFRKTINLKLLQILD